MDVNAIVASLSGTRLPRATLYLNEETVNSYFAQVVTAVSEIVRSESFQPEVSANLLGIFGSKFTAGQEQTISTSLSPLLKAMLIDYEARSSGRMIDLSTAAPQPGAMLSHLGYAHIVDITHEVSASNTGWPAEVAQAVQRERTRQEERLRARDPARRTIVWTSPVPDYMAAIGSDKWVNDGFMASYAMMPPFGLLGRYERQLGDVTLIAPFWIWHDGW
jgi:hypothetical protein